MAFTPLIKVHQRNWGTGNGVSLAEMQGDASYRIFFDLQFTIVGKITMKWKENLFTDLPKSSPEFPELN